MANHDPYLDKLAWKAQQTGLGVPYLGIEQAKQALALKRSGVKLTYIAVRFNVSDASILTYIRHAEQLEQSELDLQEQSQLYLEGGHS